MRILKHFSTECRRVCHGTTEGMMFDWDDPCFMKWYTIELKLFGIKWIKVCDYIALFYLNEKKNAPTEGGRD